MDPTKSDTRSRAAWALARRQWGVLSRAQLLGLGFEGDAIKHRVRRGRLHPIWRGVYAVGWPQLSREGRWMAALLCCGDGAVLSHRSAAALWEIGSELSGLVEVSVRRRCEHDRNGLRVRGRPSLADRDLVDHRRIPTTTPARTILDLATLVGPAALERAVNEADSRDLVDPPTLRARLDGEFHGQPGARPLRALLAPQFFRLSDSDLEVLFRPLARAVGLPEPETRVQLNGYPVDFFWPDLGLVVETDGLRYHRTAATQTRDALRDQAHTAAGLTPLRFSHHQVRYEPAHVQRILAATAARLAV